jgi:hypothetical protein
VNGTWRRNPMKSAKKTNDIFSWQLTQTIWGEGGRWEGTRCVCIVIISTMTTQSNFFHLLENLITSLVCNKWIYGTIRQVKKKKSSNLKSRASCEISK